MINCKRYAKIPIIQVAPYRVDVLRDGGGRADPLLGHLGPPHPVLQRRPAVVLRPARSARPAAQRVGGRLKVVIKTMRRGPFWLFNYTPEIVLRVKSLIG